MSHFRQSNRRRCWLNVRFLQLAGVTGLCDLLKNSSDVASQEAALNALINLSMKDVTALDIRECQAIPTIVNHLNATQLIKVDA